MFCHGEARSGQQFQPVKSDCVVLTEIYFTIRRFGAWNRTVWVLEAEELFQKIESVLINIEPEG